MPRLTPAVKWMLIVFGALFVVELIIENWVPGRPRFGTFGALYPNLILFDGHHVFHGHLWRLVTYPLVNEMQGDISPLLWGSLSIYFFGTDLEDQLGTSRFLVFVFLNVLLAGIVAWLYGWLAHPVYFSQPIAGITALSLALTAAWGTRFPNRRLFFPPVSGKWLVIGLLVIELIYVLARATQQSPAASIGAIGIGFLLTRYWDRIDDLLDRMRIRRARAKRDRVLRAIRGGLDVGPKSKKPIDKRFLN